ncbi:MAG TPA: 16S rRNA (guanine(966)-N(2))-methyltransferase RsmD [Kofleriaceae bacterium]|jgi:16S rRNA (guanine(966)-N(2))-methyltransferase RsmD|nr:16S rRNA (guanine(966)-N(2))-methyltransferase RsmD [Kofleriaceae bacterium]
MRIVGGDLRGRVLQAPAGMDTRPTSEKVREAIFNILPDMVDREVLDVFAGSGALGLEALSRGAEFATFIEKSRTAAQVLRANIDKLKLGDRTKVVSGDALTLVKRPLAQRPYSLVFIDPPYKSDLAVRAATAFSRVDLDSDAIVVIEHDRSHVPPETLGSLLRTDQRTYGDTMVSFFRVAK